MPGNAGRRNREITAKEIDLVQSLKPFAKLLPTKRKRLLTAVARLLPTIMLKVLDMSSHAKLYTQ